jgi:hypothetical protein
VKGIDPRDRQRVEIVPVRPSLRRDVSNAELILSYKRTMEGKLAPKTLEGYLLSLADAFRYFHVEEREVPARAWTKEEVWSYLHYVESNYCGSYRPAPHGREGVTCRKRVWVGAKPAAAATKEHCVGCLLFRAQRAAHRVNALSSFFKHLARVGAVPLNFMTDLSREYYDDLVPESPRERRRNPRLEEVVRLVNGTLHPMRRAFYAASAKWWFRPQEMLRLDRYASFGLPMPEGLPSPPGFQEAFAKHSYLPSFAQGGKLVYVPFKNGPAKRLGNRWMVIDAELRPILEQYFAWWERKVQRDPEGRPTTTRLWLNDRGTPLVQDRLYPKLFIEDCERLGIMQPGDRENPEKTITAHCMRHFGEQICENHHVPDPWPNHFRGDVLGDARRHYNQPKPEEIQDQYLRHVPLLGFHALAQSARDGTTPSIEDLHRQVLLKDLDRLRRLRDPYPLVVATKITGGGEAYLIPSRVAPSFMFALRILRPGIQFLTGARGRACISTKTTIAHYEWAIGAL